MLDVRLRKNMDLVLLGLTALTLVIGLIALFSATRDGNVRGFTKQCGAMAVGLIAMAALAWVNPSRLARLARIAYVCNLLLLLVVWRYGAEAKGATRWISIMGVQFQPSELAKLVMIICLGAHLAARQGSLREPGALFGSLAYVGLPTFLIFKQPDLGTALVLVAVWFGMTFVGGARRTHLLFVLLAASLMFGAMWRLNILHDYQKHRLTAFLDPEVDPKDAGYHVRQARIAVGSGQVWGKGYRRGTQVRGKFIPEKHTDFIYTIVGEEGGFVASVLLVVVYGGILLRGLSIVAQADEFFSRTVAAGVLSMLAFHVIVNVGMVIGILPVAGVPLPFVSYGGTALVQNMASIGLLVGIGMRRHRLSF